MLKIGINGFGRIGRFFLRAAIADNLKITAINDPYLNADYMAYLLRYDSTHGNFVGSIESTKDSLIVNGNKIRVLQKSDPREIKWQAADAEYILESSGEFALLEEGRYHLEGGAKKVVMTTYSPNAPTFIAGVNLSSYKPDMQVVSCCTSVTVALAPLIKVLDYEFGITEGFVTSIHAVCSIQKPVDSVHYVLKRFGRSCMTNIIPAPTYRQVAVPQIFPELAAKIKCITIFVPVNNVSVLDFNVYLKNSTTFKMVDEALHSASEGYLKGILGYTDEDVVSSDFNFDTNSATFDSKASSALTDKFMKLVAWHDNEIAYSLRALELMKYIYHTDCA